MPQRPVRNLIARQKILTTGAETTVDEAARLMKKKMVGAVMVVRNDGALAGIFTERDALNKMCFADWRAVFYDGLPVATRARDSQEVSTGELIRCD